MPQPNPSTNSRQSLGQWFLAGVTLLVLGTVLAFGLWRQHQHIEHVEQNRLLASSRTIQIGIEQNLTTIHQTLGRLSQDVADGRVSDLNTHLATLVDAMPAVRTLTIHDATAAIRWSSRPGLIGIPVDLTERAYFKTPRQQPNPDRLYVSSPFTTSTGIYSFALTRMISGSMGEFAGVVVATIDPEYFRPLLESAQYETDMATSLHHDDGTLFMMYPAPPKGVIGSKLDQPDSFFRRHQESGSAHTVYSGTVLATGEQRMIAQVDVRPAGIEVDHLLGITSSRRLSEIYRFWHQDVLIASGMFCLFVVVVCAALFLHQRKAPANDERASSVRPYRAITLAAVLLLTGIFAGIGSWIISLGNARAEFVLQQEIQGLKMAYEVSQTELEHQLSVLVQELAADPAIVRLLAQTKTEGWEGARQNPQLQRLHDDVQRTLAPRWESLRQSIDVRQLQVVLPGSVSLLRMHSPESYGDTLKGIRHLLDDVEQTLLPRSGFETGRAFAGLRAAAPIMLKAKSAPPQFLGTVEIGIQFDRHIARLGRQTGIGYGVLLKAESTQGVMWDKLQAAPAGQDRQPCCVLLTASRPELADWLAESRLPPDHAASVSELIEQRGKTFQLIRFPFVDFRGKFLANAEPVGSMVIWRDVTPLVESNHQYQWQVGTYVALAYVFALTLLLLLLRASRREWQHQLFVKTAEVVQLSHQKEVLLEALGEGVLGIDPQGRTTFINTAALRMLGFPLEQVIGHDQHALFHHHRPDGSNYPANDCPIHATLTDGISRSHDEWFIRSTGEGFAVRVTVAAIDESRKQSGAVLVFRDITEQKRREEELIRLATIDALTGVANRRHFTDQLAQELRRIKRTNHAAAVMMMDLDFFKHVNDTYGHATGDLVLQRFIEVARRTLRTVDVLGRLGGEEFAALLPDSGIEDALEAGERLRKALESESVTTAEGNIHITVSMGVTLLWSTDEKPDQALNRADEALYAAKRNGRNRVEYLT